MTAQDEGRTTGHMTVDLRPTRTACEQMVQMFTASRTKAEEQATLLSQLLELDPMDYLSLDRRTLKTLVTTTLHSDAIRDLLEEALVIGFTQMHTTAQESVTNLTQSIQNIQQALDDGYGLETTPDV